MNLDELTPSQLVGKLWDKTQRNDVIVALVGGITATELRSVVVTDAARQALIDGLEHPSSNVRWWCIQLMDHIADDRYRYPLLHAAQTDPSPKNRRHAIHALTCEVCKPDRCRLDIDPDLRAQLEIIAQTDSDESVRGVAREALAELAQSE